MLLDYFKLAVKNIRKRKLRSFLTLFGIVISISIIFILVSLSLGLQSAIQQQFQQLGGDKLFLQPLGQLGPPNSETPRSLTVEDAEMIEKISGVKSVSYIMAGNGKVEFNKESRYYPVYGLPENGIDLFLSAGSIKIAEGKAQLGNKQVLLGTDFNTGNLYSKPVRARDKITINGEEFTVSGIFAPIGNPGDDRNVIISDTDFKQMFNSGDNVYYIIIQVQDPSNIKSLAEVIDRKLMRFRDVTNKTKDYTLLTPEELMKSFTNILDIITYFLVGVASISLLVGAVGIANTMYTSVLERTREIGIMKAIGARNSDILAIFTIESGLIGAIGGILGVAVGFGIAKLTEFIAVTQINTTLLRAAAPAYLILGCIGFAFVIGIVSGIFPARHASTIKTVDALRYE